MESCEGCGSTFEQNFHEFYGVKLCSSVCAPRLIRRCKEIERDIFKDPEKILEIVRIKELVWMHGGNPVKQTEWQELNQWMLKRFSSLKFAY